MPPRCTSGFVIAIIAGATEAAETARDGFLYHIEMTERNFMDHPAREAI
jgi:hypothetical protein